MQEGFVLVCGLQSVMAGREGVSAEGSMYEPAHILVEEKAKRETRVEAARRKVTNIVYKVPSC